MFEIDYIAVPVDFSRASKQALKVAQGMARKETTVEPVHVVDQWPTFMQDVLFPYAPLGEDAAEVEHELVEAATASITDYHGLEEAPPVKYGPLKETLVEHIRSNGAQLVVLGASGETGASPDVLGSVTQRIVRSSNRPTLIVRESGTTAVNKILLALDLTEGSRRVFEFALGVAIHTGAELEILHVVSDPLADDHSNVLASVLKFDRRQVASRVRDRVEALFERMMRSLSPGYAEQGRVQELASKRHVAFGEPASEIIDRAQQLQADIVIVGNRRASRTTASYLGGTASKVATRAPCHVAVVPVPDSARMAGED